MSMRRGLLAVVVLVLAAGGGYYWYRTSAGAGAPIKKAAPPVQVTLGQVQQKDLPITLEVVGRAEAYDTVTLRSRLDGQVAAVAYTEGQHVRQGEVLVRLDPADFEARLRQAEANLARDQAQWAKARQDVERYVSLRGKGFVSEEKVGDTRTAAEAMAATIKADQAAVDLARLQLGYTTLKAPFAGQVGARLVAPGAAVKINDTALAVVNRVQPLYVSFAVPEKYLPKLRANLRAGAMKVVVGVPGNAALRFEGTARFLDNAVDAATGTIQMKAVLPNESEQLLPGQFLNVTIALDLLRDVVTIPAQALQQGPQGSFVFAVDADGVTHPRPVEVAAVEAGTAVITKGLQANETVVVDGQLRLTPGARVAVKSPAAAAPATRP